MFLQGAIFQIFKGRMNYPNKRYCFHFMFR
jgi:hypothetical protein